MRLVRRFTIHSTGTSRVSGAFTSGRPSSWSSIQASPQLRGLPGYLEQHCSFTDQTSEISVPPVHTLKPAASREPPGCVTRSASSEDSACECQYMSAGSSCTCLNSRIQGQCCPGVPNGRGVVTRRNKPAKKAPLFARWPRRRKPSDPPHAPGCAC